MKQANEHISAAELPVLANKLNLQEAARQAQATHAKRTIGIWYSNGKTFVMKTVQEPTATESTDVTVID